MLGSRRSSESSSTGAGAGARGGGTSAVVCGRNEETRLLLRGLLRLHRFRVVQEVGTVDDLDRLGPASEPTVLVFDAESEVGAWDRELARALGAHPALRAVVILPRGSSTSEARARTAGASAVVARPFAIRELVEGVERAAAALGIPRRQP